MASPTRPTKAKPSVCARRPARVRALGDRVDDRAEARRCEGRAPQIQSAPPRLFGVGRDHLDRGDRERDGDREIDEEDHPPVGELREQTTSEDADRRARAADCTPGGERLCLCESVEAGRDDRQRCRREHRRAEALTGTRREERAGGSREGRGERGEGEDGEPRQEQAAPSEEVSGSTTEEQEAPEDEGVAGDRPADL